MRSFLIHSCVAFAIFACAAAREENRLLLDGVAAYCNERVVTIGDVMSAIEPVRRQLVARFSGDELREKLNGAFAEALNALVERYLVLDAYADSKGMLPEWVVDSRVNEIIEGQFGGDRSALMKALSEEQLTFDDWREQAREQIIVASMRRAHVEEQVMVSPGESRDFYESHIEEFIEPEKISVRMIVLNKGTGVEENAAKRRQIDSIHHHLQAGEDFAVQATEFSEGGKADKGGDWGWIEPRMLRPDLAKAAQKLAPSDISDVIETHDGFYILRVDGRREASTQSFEDVQPLIEKELRRSAAAEIYEAWVERLKRKAFVKIVTAEVF